MLRRVSPSLCQDNRNPPREALMHSARMATRPWRSDKPDQSIPFYISTSYIDALVDTDTLVSNQASSLL